MATPAFQPEPLLQRSPEWITSDCAWKLEAKLRAHPRKRVSAPPPVEGVAIAERCSPARVRCAALTRALACSAPFGKVKIATGGSDGNSNQISLDNYQPAHGRYGIAEHIGDAARARGFEADVVRAAELPAGFSLTAYSKAVVAASVHGGRHEKEIVDFVKRYVSELDGMPAAFISMSLSQAGAEDAAASPEQRAKAAAEVDHMMWRFLTETRWHPSKIKAVAGALMYSKYNFILRWVMKRVAKAAGASTDTSRDHEFTDWLALDRFLDNFLQIPVASGSRL